MKVKNIYNLIKKNISFINLFSKDYFNTIKFHYLNTFLYLVFQLIQIPIFLKVFDENHFGILLFFVSLINFSSIGIGWMSSGLIKSFGEYGSLGLNEKVEKTFYLSKKFTVYYVLFFILIFLISSYFFDYKNVRFLDFTLSSILICLAIFFKLLPNPEIQYLNSIDKQSTPIIIDSYRVFFLILLILIFKDNFKYIFQIILLIMISIFAQYIFLKSYSPKIKIIKDKSKINFRKDFMDLLGKRSLKYGLLGFLILFLQSDLIILNYLSKPELIKEYIINWKIPEFIFLLFLKIPASFEPSIIKYFAKNEFDKIKNLHKKFFYIYHVLLILAVLIYFFFSETLVRLWLGNEFKIQSINTLLCCLNLFLITSMRWNLAFLHAIAKLDFLIKFLSLEVILKTTLTILLIDIYDFMSPIISSLICHTLLFFWIYSNMHKKYIYEL